ncbi:MAG: hypothetical protein AB1551_05055 [Actinomycetota bacterium]
MTGTRQSRSPAMRATERLRGLDILANNAGITRDRTFHDLDDGQSGFRARRQLPHGLRRNSGSRALVRESVKRETAARGTAVYARQVTIAVSSTAIVCPSGRASHAAADGALIDSRPRA